MARFTLLEVHLEGAEFSANASGSANGPLDAKETVESALGERLGRGSASSESDSRFSPVGLAVGLVFLAGVATLVRRLLSERNADTADTDTERPLLAD